MFFFYFSSALNTVQRFLLGRKLSAMQVDHSLSVQTFLVPSSPGWCVCEKLLNRVAALSPFLFTMYTTDLCHMQKFLDDSAVVSCIRDKDMMYRVVDNFC